jgi:DNA-binding ferritin-like protein
MLTRLTHCTLKLTFHNRKINIIDLTTEPFELKNKHWWMKAKECFRMFTVLEEVYKKVKERSGMNRWKTVGQEALSTGKGY